jgi:outer membrane protein, heavy metal efflux system
MKDAPDGLRTAGFIGLKFRLPLPFWNKNEGKIHEAAAAAAKARSEREALALRIRAETSAAQAEMDAAAKIIDQTSGPLMKKAKELEEKYAEANKLGQAPLTDVLRSRERRFALEAARLDALRDYHLARVRLLAAQGQ